MDICHKALFCHNPLPHSPYFQILACEFAGHAIPKSIPRIIWTDSLLEDGNIAPITAGYFKRILRKVGCLLLIIITLE
jgi:hypothetical protein